MPMTYAYDEATLDLLRLTIPTYGILVPIIQQSGTNEIIDGRHRLKVREELKAQGVKIMLPVHHVDTNNPEEIDQIVNSVRRPWQDAEQRRELVKKLHNKGHSQRKIADTMGAAQSTINKDLKAKTAGDQNRSGADTKPKASKGKDGKSYTPPATPEQIAEAWGMKDAGMNAAKIAQNLGFGATTVRKWFKKQRPEAVQQAQPKPTPSVPSAGSSEGEGQPPAQGDAPHGGQPTHNPVPNDEEAIGLVDHSAKPINWAEDPLLDGWNGSLGEPKGVAQRIYDREVKASRFRVEAANRLAEIKNVLEKTMNAAKRNHKEERGALLEQRVKMVEATLQKEERPGINDSLLAVMHEAERIYKYASTTRRLLQLDKP